ncbi:MAG TPA: LuxR C-terminal-related transcriptional regulator [Dehalococcoidia bacterium]|nr:LuxR C-terminal-related transcriptional regulator [Dehalococcoidia bacterium]
MGAPAGHHEGEVFARIRTLDGLFVTDRDQRILYWSDSAARLLGVDAASAVGRSCFEVLVGVDYAGHPFCREECPIAANAARGRPVRDYEVTVQTHDGQRKLINNSVLLWPREGGGSAVLHLFREVRPSRRFAARGRRARPRRESDSLATPLSRREIEALRLAANGMKTADIAAAMGVSFFTARNQLASVVRKLNARNRIEAVTRATENGLL